MVKFQTNRRLSEICNLRFPFKYPQDWYPLCHQSSRLWTLQKYVLKDLLQAGEGSSCQVASEVACTRSFDWRGFLWEVRCSKLSVPDRLLSAMFNIKLE